MQTIMTSDAKRAKTSRLGAAKYKSKFNSVWCETYPVRSVFGDMYKFHCIPCSKKLSCDHQGIKDVASHCTKFSSKSIVSKTSATKDGSSTNYLDSLYKSKSIHSHKGDRSSKTNPDMLKDTTSNSYKVSKSNVLKISPPLISTVSNDPVSANKNGSSSNHLVVPSKSYASKIIPDTSSVSSKYLPIPGKLSAFKVNTQTNCTTSSQYLGISSNSNAHRDVSFIDSSSYLSSLHGKSHQMNSDSDGSLSQYLPAPTQSNMSNSDTEGSLSQETYLELKALHPNLDDEINMCHDVVKQNYGGKNQTDADKTGNTSDTDTETEAPLSQETYLEMKVLQPNLSDEISAIKEEYETPSKANGSLSGTLKDFLVDKQLSNSERINSFIQHVNDIPIDQLQKVGKYGFRINLECEESPAKSCKYTFSKSLGKLFVQMDKDVPITFNCQLSIPAGDAEIRSYLVYKDKQSRECIVDRCPHHLNMRETFPNHVMDSLKADHMTCPSTKRYVTILKPGITHNEREINTFVGQIRFRCTSACRGGIDRRATLALFELYLHHKFMGRAVLEVSICTSPGRDRMNQEKKFYPTNPNIPPNLIDSMATKRGINDAHRDRDDPKKTKLIPLEDEDEYYVKVKGYDNAVLLSGMAERMNQLEDMKKKFLPGRR